VRDQVSHPYSTAGKNTVLYTLINNVLHRVITVLLIWFHDVITYLYEQLYLVIAQFHYRSVAEFLHYSFWYLHSVSINCYFKTAASMKFSQPWKFQIMVFTSPWSGGSKDLRNVCILPHEYTASPPLKTSNLKQPSQQELYIATSFFLGVYFDIRCNEQRQFHRCNFSNSLHTLLNVNEASYNETQSADVYVIHWPTVMLLHVPLWHNAL
jgi:hypothetical protein